MENKCLARKGSKCTGKAVVARRRWSVVVISETVREAVGRERLGGYKEPAQLGCAYLLFRLLRVCFSFFFASFYFCSNVIFSLTDYNLRG